AREPDPLADLALALARPFAEAPFELGDRRRDEDRDRAWDVLLHVQGALRLQLEHGHVTGGGDPVDLRAERAVPLPGNVRNVLEEVAPVDAADELGVGEKPVLAAVLLAATPQPRRRRDRHLEVRQA